MPVRLGRTPVRHTHSAHQRVGGCPAREDGDGASGDAGDGGADNVDWDEQEELDRIDWEDELLEHDIVLDEPTAGPSGILHDEDVEMKDAEPGPEEDIDELAGDCGWGRGMITGGMVRCRDMMFGVVVGA
ncbi:hypothetical protein FRC08_004500 [Ceratobasidium sp. 394]|nr:hypothetical protein FRC08_004500 [Ceratobasidium sp. 394]KAG9101968.1 hypothetical protein FS749_001017 [Ceratobasidium sp. UAMH 11750]